MKHNELVQALVKPGQDIVDTLTAEKANLWHMATGIAGEADEVLYGLLKDDLDNVKEELGDVEFYLEGLCQELDFWPENPKVEIPLNDTIAPVMIVAAGDVLDAVKKLVVYNTGDIEPIMQAVIALRTSLDGCYEYMGIDRDEVLQLNIAKLQIRYGETYSDEAAQQRADKEGVE